MGLRLEFECKDLNLYYYGTKLCGYFPNDSLSCVDYLIRKNLIEKDVYFDYGTSPFIETDLITGCSFLILYCNDLMDHGKDIPEDLWNLKSNIYNYMLNGLDISQIKCTITWD